MYLNRFRKKISSLCKKNNVKQLFVFGSVLTSSFSEHSDIDLLVSIDDKDPIKYAENYFNLKFELEKLLNRKIDLLEEKGLKNKYFIENINNSKLLIYGA
ncbi:nucleotidyltransferase domain-containing protein [uncultured Polaribacter sp.]|uniref:nucleotidyltransferase family protein n=1 Tax=uncultured Polaribacter sp. TaxID=174711 RepID=UPI002634239A|nr:nucleotidyltransferase domain-containing protein [uncultured Polaribacter sp.]